MNVVMFNEEEEEEKKDKQIHRYAECLSFINNKLKAIKAMQDV